jgi:pantoate kinase
MAGGTACGRGGYTPLRTQATADVTCQRCQNTYAFGSRQTVERLAADRDALTAAASQVTANMATKAVLDAIFESAYKVADRAGYCSTFEEIVGDIEVPAWYEIPERGERFEIEVKYGMAEIVAADEDEAYAMIAADVRKYIAL